MKKGYVEKDKNTNVVKHNKFLKNIETSKENGSNLINNYINNYCYDFRGAYFITEKTPISVIRDKFPNMKLTEDVCDFLGKRGTIYVFLHHCGTIPNIVFIEKKISLCQRKNYWMCQLGNPNIDIKIKNKILDILSINDCKLMAEISKDLLKNCLL